MPRSRKETDFSAPTVLRWLKIYYGEIPEMMADGRLYEAQGRKVAKGLGYAIKALEESAVEFRRQKVSTQAKKYDEAKAQLK